jgi:heme-degrading monooxygenase HmoA
MFAIAKTPDPPYYAVIAPAVLSGDVTGYPDTALRLMELAHEIDGFLGIESCIHGNFSLAVSYWRSLEAIGEWRRRAEHLDAKARGKTQWFSAYLTRIAKVERVY